MVIKHIDLFMIKNCLVILVTKLHANNLSLLNSVDEDYCVCEHARMHICVCACACLIYKY